MKPTLQCYGFASAQPRRWCYRKNASLIIRFSVITGAQFVLMMKDEANNALPAMVLGLPLNQSLLAEHVAQEVWLLHWQRIVRMINAASSSLSTPLIRQVQRRISAPITLADIERGLTGVDIPMVRGAVFELLRTGRIRSPQLHRQTLSHLTVFEPAV